MVEGIQYVVAACLHEHHGRVQAAPEERARRSGADEDIGALRALGLLGKGEDIRYVAVRDLDFRLACIFGNNARDLDRQLARTFNQREVTDQEKDAGTR